MRRDTHVDNRTQLKIGSLLAFMPVCAAWMLLAGFYKSYAQDITILYTGDTHAMLYTCSCPIETDGGVARRATALTDLRKENPGALVLESGGFFAGGVLDEWGQNTELDKVRTAVNLQALEIMQYDALALGTAEFNFGRLFLEEQIQKVKIPLLTCNVKSESFRPYIIKEVEGIKIGITAVTTLEAMGKSEDLTFIEPKKALAQTVQELRQKNVAYIVLLCQLEKGVDLNFIKSVEGIDLAIMGRAGSSKQESSGIRVNSTIVVWPSWQGRHISKLTLKIAGNKIQDFKNEEIRLSDKIPDAPEIAAILPKCFSEANCKKEGFVSACLNPGTMSAQCSFTVANKIKLMVIEPKDALFSQARATVHSLKQRFPGLEMEFLYYPEAKAKKIIKELGVATLPVFLFSKEIEKELAFGSLKESLEAKPGGYLLKPQASGISLYLDRPAKFGQFDVFVSAYDKKVPELLERLKNFKPRVHFLVLEKDGVSEAMQGPGEVEESLRMVCVQQYAPEEFSEYLKCRSGSFQSAWWEDCLKAPESTEAVKTCAKGAQGGSLLRQNTALNKELNIMYGPTYLMNNQEIFSSRGVPSEEELQKIGKK